MSRLGASPGSVPIFWEGEAPAELAERAPRKLSRSFALPKIGNRIFKTQPSAQTAQEVIPNRVSNNAGTPLVLIGKKYGKINTSERMYIYAD